MYLQTAKNSLNNLWGKFAQRSNLGSSTFFDDPAKFYELILADEVDLKGIHIVNENMVLVNHSKSEMFEEELPNTNVCVASYVTAYGRLELYSHMEQLQERLLYVDTDSCILRSPRDVTKETLRTGTALGDLGDELKSGEHITEFVSGGPKCYAYRTSSGREKVTVKGITLNSRNSGVVTFDLLKEIVLGEGRDSVQVTEPYKFVRNFRKRSIHTEPFAKIFRKVYTKRRVLSDNISTLPFGYKD